MRLIDIGHGNLVSDIAVVSVVSPDSAPVKRLIRQATDAGRLIDASYGRKTRSVIIMRSDHVVLSSLEPTDLQQRFSDAERF